MSNFVERDFPRLIDLIYDAALNPNLWQTFLDALPGCFGDASGVLYTFDRQEGLSPFSYIFGAEPSFLPSYAQHYSELNPYISAALSLPLGKVVPATECVGLEVVQRSQFFNEWMKPQGIPADHPGVLLRSDGQQGTILGMAPQVSDFKRHRDAYFKHFQMLVPHVARALELNRTTALGSAPGLLEGAIEAFAAAAFVVDRTSYRRP